MGRDVAEASTEAMDLWKKAEKCSGLPLRAVYWESDDATLMADTRHLQPALTVVNLNLWRMAAPRAAALGLQIRSAAGHSLGEYAALAAAGVLSPETTLNLVSLRGALMAESDPAGKGAMVAVLKLDHAEVEAAVAKVCEATGEVLLIANHNTPAQYVVSGAKIAVAHLMPEIRDRKGRAVPLAVSGAFHSPFMAEAARELAIALDKATWNRPRFPVWSNVSGTAISDGESLHDLARKQMTSPVLWIDTVRGQWQDGTRVWLESGPKGVLSRMIKPILAEPRAAANAPEAVVLAVDSLDAARNLALPAEDGAADAGGTA